MKKAEEAVRHAKRANHAAHSAAKHARHVAKAAKAAASIPTKVKLKIHHHHHHVVHKVHVHRHHHHHHTTKMPGHRHHVTPQHSHDPVKAIARGTKKMNTKNINRAAAAVNIKIVKAHRLRKKARRVLRRQGKLIP